MSRRKTVVLFVLCASLVVVLAILALRPRGGAQESMLRVVFLDVGQGDATFIESPSGTQVLIDGGANAGVLRGLGREMRFFDRTIDFVIATHPDQDHIGGLVDVLRRYEVKAILLTENESDSPVAQTFLDLVKEEGAMLYYARRGQVYDLGRGASGSTTLTILFPDRDPKGLESNASSIVAQLRYGDVEFMFTGDSPIAIEEYLVLLYGGRLRSEVLKVGHHGSRTSSSEAFVSAVLPEYAIISAGKDNRYGHPHKEVSELLTQHGINTKNTAHEGSISFVSNGAGVQLK